MAEIKIAAIMRAGAYSPNHIGNDAAILNAAAEQLRKRGCLVNIYSEEQFNTQGVEENVILNMCREQKSIENLQKAEDAGKIVINSGFGIENCTRERMTRILLRYAQGGCVVCASPRRGAGSASGVFPPWHQACSD